VVPLIHTTYLDKETQARIAVAYKANPLPSVQLQGFLEPKAYNALMKEVKKAKYSREVSADKYSRSTAKMDKKHAELFKGLFELIQKVTGKKIKGLGRIEQYSHRDFTLRNDEEKPPGLLIYFDCTPDWHPQFGGATIISNEFGELARVNPTPNTLVIIDCSKAWPFTQYINHYAGKKTITRIVIK
jgi:hypothetical protein